MSSPRRSTDSPPSPPMSAEGAAGPSTMAPGNEFGHLSVQSEIAEPDPADSHDTAAPSEPQTTLPQPVPDAGLPRIHWTTRVPTFFVMGPGGGLIPHFAPTTASPNNSTEQVSATPTLGAPSDRQDMDSPAPTAHSGNAQLAQPRPTSIPAGIPPFFPFFFQNMFGPRERQPDPEAAAELLRSLPTVEKGLFKRVNRVIVAEQVQDEDTAEEKGWRCGICLEGVEDGAKETGVKVLPCNHLFHGDCLEPWLTTNYTW
jgi:hypothetical protein